MSDLTRANSKIPAAVHARLAGTIAVAGTVPALFVFLLARPAESLESAAVWFLAFPFTCAIAGGVFTPRIRRYLPDSYPVKTEYRRLRSVVFTAGLILCNYAVALFLYSIAIAAGVIFATSGAVSPLAPALFVVLSAVVLSSFPLVHVSRKHNETTGEFTFEAKDRTIAGLLGLCVGGFGAHRFYVGKRRTGCLYLLFCWTLVPWLLGWYEAYRYASMDVNEFERVVAEANGEPRPGEFRESSERSDT